MVLRGTLTHHTKQRWRISPEQFSRQCVEGRSFSGSAPLPVTPAVGCCSVKLLKWPKSLQLQLYEKGALKDDFLAEVFLAVPGTASTAPIDGAAKPYSWTSLLPYKQRPRSAAPSGRWGAMCLSWVSCPCGAQLAGSGCMHKLATASWLSTASAPLVGEAARCA
jgi:hypothetical protein